MTHSETGEDSDIIGQSHNRQPMAPVASANTEQRS